MENQLKPHDRLLARTILGLIPSWVQPNHVTWFRFVMTPVVLLVLWQGWYAWTLALFLLVAFSDVIDGSLARSRNQISDWGKLYDPLADKFLIGSLVIVLVYQHLGPFLALTILGLEASFIGLAWWWLHEGITVQANRWGKIKMCLQVLGVTLLLLELATGFEGFKTISGNTFYLAILFAILSLFSSGV